MSVDTSIVESARSPSAAVRALLMNVPPRIEQLNAFCFDYYHFVFVQWSGQMSRDLRVHMLLEVEYLQLSALVAKLRAVFPREFADYARAVPTILALGDSAHAAFPKRRLRLLFGSLGTGALALAVAALVSISPWGQKRTQIASSDPGRAVPQLESTPSKAQVVYDGRLLGHTPLSLSKIPTDAYQVCLRVEDHADQVVELKRPSVELASLHVYLMPRREYGQVSPQACRRRDSNATPHLEGLGASLPAEASVR